MHYKLSLFLFKQNIIFLIVQYTIIHIVFLLGFQIVGMHNILILLVTTALGLIVIIFQEVFQMELKVYNFPWIYIKMYFIISTSFINFNNTINLMSLFYWVEGTRSLKRPETGMCRTHVNMYYFNATSQTCEIFTYGGKIIKFII